MSETHDILAFGSRLGEPQGHRIRNRAMLPMGTVKTLKNGEALPTCCYWQNGRLWTEYDLREAWQS